jgi:hypothetical protein
MVEYENQIPLSYIFLYMNINFEEVMHDIGVNHYGDRYASASSHQGVKVYETDDGQWVRPISISSFDGPVYKVKWADPQFGSILATVHTNSKQLWEVCLWEERKYIHEEAIS